MVLDQPLNHPPFDDDSDEDVDDEDAYDLREVSSDVEMNPEDIDGLESDARRVRSHPHIKRCWIKPSSVSRFEEVKEEEAIKPQKRPRESDAVDGEAPKLSKAEKKKNKKQKAEGGIAVPTGEESSEKKEEKKEKKEKKAGDEPKTKELPGGIKIKDSKVGTGPQAKKGNTVLMRYIGKLENGKIFDKNVKGKPVCPHVMNLNTAHLTLLQFTFHLGQGEVIKGKLVCSQLMSGLTRVLHRLGWGHRRNAGGWRAGPHDPTCDGIRQEGFRCYSSELYSYLWYSPFT